MTTEMERAALLLTDALTQLLMTNETDARRIRCALDSVDAAREALCRECYG